MSRITLLSLVCLISGPGFLQAQARTQPGQPITPVGAPIQLFNGKDFQGLYTWLKDSQREDPSKVFKVENGMLRVSGEPQGYVATVDEYTNYRLLVEYKWGERTYGSKTVRNSGILLHATGPDGGRSPWMSSIECQLAQGCVGDFIVIRGKDAGGSIIPVTITSDVELGPDKRPRWKPGGTRTVYSSRQFWWSRHDPDFRELIDTRGRWDVESPLEDWTRVECTCTGNRIRVAVNGQAVNECYDIFPRAGKILLQSEGFEIWFRKFELHPIDAAKKD
jgi:hypothetical protein